MLGGMDRAPLKLTAWERAELAKLRSETRLNRAKILALLISALATLLGATQLPRLQMILSRPDAPVIRHCGPNATMPGVIGMGHG
jgi:hypothetical protein